MNKIAFTAIIALAVLLSACAGEIPQPEQSSTTYFAVTDAAVDMETVSAVEVTFSELSVHQQGGAWMNVEIEQTTFDLMELEAESALALLAQAELESGTYDMVRLQVDQVTVTDDNGSNEAFVPSGRLQMNTQLVVEEGETSTATFDFRLNESLHITEEGQYILTPVVAVETRSGADASVDARNRVNIRAGTVRANQTLGMGVDGEMREGVQVTPGANVTFSDGNIRVVTPAGVTVGVDIGAGVGADVVMDRERRGSSARGNASAGVSADDDGVEVEGGIAGDLY